jgi:hypothetical protein
VAQAAQKDNRISITVVGGEGDEESVEINENAPLNQLLHKGVKALYGDSADPSAYDLIITGAIQEDLTVKVEDAGLAESSEVTILAKDVSRG